MNNVLNSGIASPAAALLAFISVLWTRQVLGDADTWWHVAAGRVMIERGEVLHADPFSHTFRGQPWPSHEWLSEVLFAAAFNLGGWPGVILLVAAATGLAAWLFAAALGRQLSGLAYVLTLLLCMMMVSPHLLVRPHLLALPLLVVWTIELLRAREEARAPRWAFAALMALWANLHGGFMIGLALTGAFAVEAVLLSRGRDRLRQGVRWSVFGLLAGAFALLTPHGLSGFLFPFKLTDMWVTSRIGEWAPAELSVHPLTVALAAGAYVLATRPVSVPPYRAILLLGLVWASLTHIRHEQLLAVVGGLIFAEPLARALRQEQPAPNPRRLAPAGVAALAIVVLMGAARLATPVVWKDSPTAPVSAFAQVPQELRTRPVLNEYGFGGYLVFQGTPVFVDSRAELYRDEFLQAYERLAQGRAGEIRQALQRQDVAWTLLKPDTPMTAAMDAMPGWRRLYSDRWAVVHVRAG